MTHNGGCLRPWRPAEHLAEAEGQPEEPKTSLVPPEAACAIWAQWLPNAPKTALAILRRTGRGNGPCCHMVGNKQMYDPVEVETWCREQQPPRVAEALDLSRLIDNATSAGFSVQLFGPGKDWAEHCRVEISDGGGDIVVVTSGHPRRWVAGEANAQLLDLMERSAAASADALDTRPGA